MATCWRFGPCAVRSVVPFWPGEASGVGKDNFGAMSGRSSNGADFPMIESKTGELFARGQVYNVMIGHVVLQVLSLRPEPQHGDKNIRITTADGPWNVLTVQVWPIAKKSVNWPPPASLSTAVDVTHYGHFRARFKNAKCHLLVAASPSSREKLIVRPATEP